MVNFLPCTEMKKIKIRLIIVEQQFDPERQF